MSLPAQPIRSRSQGVDPSYPSNIADFCAQKRHIGKKSIDSATLELLEDRLVKSEYVTVLKHLRDEPSQRARLIWLRNHHQLKVLHAPLYFELAAEELASNPTIETLINISLPLIAQGRSLTDLACVCLTGGTTSESANALGDRMATIYETTLDQLLTNAHLGTTTKEVIKGQAAKVNKELAKAYLNIANDIEKKSLPSPSWSGNYQDSSYSTAHITPISGDDQQMWRRVHVAHLRAHAEKLVK